MKIDLKWNKSDYEFISKNSVFEISLSFKIFWWQNFSWQKNINFHIFDLKNDQKILFEWVIHKTLKFSKIHAFGLKYYSQWDSYKVLNRIKYQNEKFKHQSEKFNF